MTANGIRPGLLSEDWNITTTSALLSTIEQNGPSIPASTSSPAAPSPAEPEVTIRRGLVLPDGVALMLDTALGGDKAPGGTPGADGRPRSKNLAVLVGAVRVMTTRRGDEQRVVTNFGAIEYRYELSINEVIGDEHGASRTSYHLPITMSDAVRSHYGHLLQDGQRIALLGPLGLEEFYDGRFQRDAYDAGRRNWDIRLDVLQVQEIGDEVPDMAWVQLEGEVVERPRVFARQYGEQRGLVEHYARVTLRYREVLAGAFGRAVRPVVKAVPVEVLIAPDEEIIPLSDALLRPGNKVRIEGRVGESDLACVKGRWYLIPTAEVEEPEPIDVEGVLGIDLGIIVRREVT